MCLINTHILMRRHARCNCKLWNAPYIIDEHSFLNCCIFNKLSQIVCLINVHTLVCQHVKYDCRLWMVILFFVDFGLLLQLTYGRQFFCDFRENVLDPSGPYINTFQTNLINVCSSVILEFCLLSVVCYCLQSVARLLRPLPAYVEA